jgi:hypothetical protein
MARVSELVLTAARNHENVGQQLACRQAQGFYPWGKIIDLFLFIVP